MTDRIGEALRSARAYLAEHPEDAAYTDSFATARIESGLRTVVTGPDGLRVVTDMPESIGGGASAPSPGWLLRAGHAACVATLIAMRAAEQGIRLDRLEVTVDSRSDDRGIVGADDAVPAGPLASRVRVEIRSEGTDAATLAELVDWGRRHCPVDDAVRRAIPVTDEVEVG